MRAHQRTGPHVAGTGLPDAGPLPSAAALRCVRHALDAARAALAGDSACVPQQPLLAAAAGVSLRSLQRHFAAVLGRSPQAELEALRLTAARQTLCDAAAPSVLDAALRHGFGHPGRFAMAYSRAFGESPSATLRAARRQAPAATWPLNVSPGVPLLLHPLRAGAAPDAPRARRATDDLAIALGAKRGLVLLNPEADPGVRPRVLDAARAGALRLEGRVEAGEVVLTLVQAASGRLVATLRERLAPRAGAAWARRAAWRVANAIDQAEVEQARRTPHHRADTEALVRRARPAILTQDPALTRMALDLLGEVLHRDPTHSRASALAGFGYAVAANHCFVRDAYCERSRAVAHAERAMALAGDDPEVLTFAAGVMSFTGQLERSGLLVRRSLALDPDQPEAWRRLGILHVFGGEPGSAAAIFRRLRRQWPDGNDGNMALIQIGIAELALGRFGPSARALSRALDAQPFRAWPHRFLVAAAWHAGAHAEARRSLAMLRSSFPDLTVEQCERSDALHAKAKALVLDGLARAGLPS